MGNAAIDPGLAMLLAMSPEELEREATAARIAISLESGEAVVEVTINTRGELPALDGVDVYSVLGNILSARVRLDAIPVLAERPEVVRITPLRRATELLHRTRQLIGTTITSGQRIRAGAEAWDGTNTTVGVIDFGFDFRHPSLRQFPGGPTRVLAYWDRQLTARPGTGDTAPARTHVSGIGIVYSRADIDAYLLGAPQTPPILHPGVLDLDAHGTHVASTAAGRGGPYQGVAPGANLVLVRYRDTDLGSLHTLCQFIFDNAAGPCAINISLGGTAGAHDGTTDEETMIDFLLRDPADLLPRQGRAVVVAAGNDRVKGWHAKVRVLRQAAPLRTQLLWAVEPGDDDVNELHLWHSGLDRIRVRLIAPVAAGNRITDWAAPSGAADAVEQADAGTFAPNAAGPAPQLDFNFANGGRGTIIQRAEPVNGDRQIVIRIEHVAGPGNPIPSGIWLVELEAVNDLPGGGWVNAYLQLNAFGLPDTALLPPSLTSRSLRVAANAPGELRVLVPLFIQRPFSVLMEYADGQELEVQVAPFFFPGSTPPSQFVGHGPAAVADAALTAPGAAVATGLPFEIHGPGTDPVIINHVTVAGRRRIAIEFTGVAGPITGIYRISLRHPPGSAGPPVDVEARVLQDHHVFDEIPAFRDELHEVGEVEVFPASCREAVVRLITRPNGPNDTGYVFTLPGGDWAEARVRIPPDDPDQEAGGWAFTPWVGPGNAETLDAGSLPLVGGAAGPREYPRGALRARLDYPAPAPGADGVITVTLTDTAFNPLTPGQWRLELRGRGITAPRRASYRHARAQDSFVLADMEVPLDPRFERRIGSTHEIDRGPTSVPFFVERETADEVRLEIVHPASANLRLRVVPPEPHALRFTVSAGQSVAVDAGAAAPASGANGVTGTLGNGGIVHIDYPAAEVFPGHRRALISLRPSGVRQDFHPTGIWRLEVEGNPAETRTEFTARLSADGHAANFLIATAPTFDYEQGTLRTPATTRDVVTVANGQHRTAPLVGMNLESSPGPVRSASRMAIGGAGRAWIPYAKPEITAPGTDIAAALSSAALIWQNAEVRGGWAFFSLPDGRGLGMRANWPLVGAGRAETRNVAPSAGGAVVEVAWPIIVPDRTGTVRLDVRYPAGRAFGLRVRQPAGPPNPRSTNAVLPNGAEVALGGAGNAVGTLAPGHPAGLGRAFRLGDGTEVLIRQGGNGRASIIIRSDGALRAGGWSVLLRHTEAFPAAVPVTIEADPFPDATGWPRLANLPAGGGIEFLPPRATLAMQVAPGPPAPQLFMGILNVIVPPRTARDVVVRITYPPPPAGPGAYNFQLVVRKVPTPGGPAHPTDGQLTRPINSAGAPVAEAGTLAPAAPVPNGRRFRFANGNDVTVQHQPGIGTITFARGNAAATSILEGIWSILVINRSLTAPAAPVNVDVEIDPGPHDAPFFRTRGDQLAYTFGLHGHLTAGTQTEWTFRVPELRRTELAVELIYDATDTVRVQVQEPGGGRTEPVATANAAAAGALGATLANTGVTADGVGFAVAGSFRLFIHHDNHPGAPGRRRVRIVLRTDGDEPVPSGDWIIRIDPTAVASNGVVEGWIEEMLHYVISGTSMAAPHITGLAALMFQQDHTQTSADIKRRLLTTARPLAITSGGNPQLPNQWDPVAGFGMVDGAAALLDHDGGLLHNRNAAPAAIGRTTGCPVACEDNCLLEGVRTNGTLVGLRPARNAPYNHSPLAVDQPGLPDCPRQSGYMAVRRSAAFSGAGTFQTIASTRVDRPLIRAREQRGGLDGFRVATWQEAYAAVAERWVEQWSNSGGVLVVEPRPHTGLVKELLFNRFSHQLHRLLGASTTVTKCSFTIKKSTSVVSSRVPFGSAGHGAGLHGLAEVANGTAAALVGRADISLARNVVLWGSNLPGTAPELWRAVLAMKTSRGAQMRLFVVDPGPGPNASGAIRLPILPGSDRDLAIALMLRIVGNAGHAEAARQIPPDPRFSDPASGIEPMLDPVVSNLDAFLTHVRTEGVPLLRIDGGRVVVDSLADRCLGAGASAAARTRFQIAFDELSAAYIAGPTATIVGGGPSRQLDGEEQVQYLAALSLLSGNLGLPGGGVAVAEDRHATFNTAAFGGAHNTRRPEDDTPEMGGTEVQETINLASMGADAPDSMKVALWFDFDPLTGLPDAGAVEGLLRRMQLNVQVTGMLDDSSRYADIILPLSDTLGSYDLQLGPRSPWINLTQPIEPLDAEGPRPFARIAHELLAALRSKLLEDFEDDLEPVITEDLMKRGPLLLSAARMREIAAFFTDATRIPNLLRERLPSDEVANIHTQLRSWYAEIHGGEPTADTDAQATVTDAARFFNRVQVDWILEMLLARYGERGAIQILYNLLQRGAALDSGRFSAPRFTTLPDGEAAHAAARVRTTPFADLKGAAGFAPERPVYRNGVRAVDNGTTGRSAYPMRLVIAEAPEYSSHAIPLSTQVEAGRIRLPTVFLNPESPSLAGRFGGALADGAEVAVVGNVSYAAGQRFETVISKAQVRTDATMARETVWMNPGWFSLGRGGQGVARGIHSEEGESPAMFDNLVRLEPANYTPSSNAADRGTPPPKR